MDSVKKKTRPTLTPEIKRFFQKTGQQGGKARAAGHTAEELSAWGKMGGRPKRSAKKQKKGGK